MTTPAKLNELNYAEDPARRLLERLGYEYVPREVLAAEREGERAREERARLHSLLAAAADALLTGRVRVAGESEVVS